MNNFCNLINKSHDVLFENLSDLIESSNVAKSKDVHVFITRDQWIKIVTASF